MKAAIYCRLSKEDEKLSPGEPESESIQNQKAMLLAYAVEHGFEISQIYCDEDYSGMDRSRPAFNALLEAASLHRFDVVLAKTQSRFTRDMELVEKYLHGKFAEWGIRFIAVVDHVDTDDRSNKKSRQINGLINEWYLEDLSTNVRSVLDHKRKAGKYIAAFALYGYQKDPCDKNHLVVDPEAAEIVRNIFSMYCSGMGSHRIAAVLNEARIPNPTTYKHLHGQKYKPTAGTTSTLLWSSVTILQMLRNRTYRGDTVQGRHQKISYKSKKTIRLPEKDWIIVPGTHEAIVDSPTFDMAQQLLRSKARSNGNGTISPLSGKLFCGCCGGKMERVGGKIQTDGRKHYYARCKQHQQAPSVCPHRECTDILFLERLVLEQIQNHIRHDVDPKKLPAPNKPSQPLCAAEAKRLERDRLQTEISQRQKAIRQLYLDSAAGRIAPAQHRLLLEGFQQETLQSQKRITVLEQELATISSCAENEASSPRAVPPVMELPVLTRALVCLLVDKITLFPGETGGNSKKILIQWLF